MEVTTLNFSCNVIQADVDGFTAEEGDYIIKFRDSKLKHSFQKKDRLNIHIENVSNLGNEETKPGYSVVYGILCNYLPNGFLFKDDKPNGLFWSTRGMLTHRKFEDNEYFEKEEKIRIIISKI